MKHYAVTGRWPLRMAVAVIVVATLSMASCVLAEGSPAEGGEPPGQVGASAPGRPTGVRAGARHLPAGLPARLFPTDLPTREFTEFSAYGFSQPVSGLIFRKDFAPCCGVALGGLGTGCLDIQSTGVLGFSTLFPAPRRHTVPAYQPFFRNAQLLLPFLGLSVGGRTWVLTTREFIEGGSIQGCTEPGMGRDLLKNETWLAAWRVNVPRIEGVEPAREIHYWGHYPVADMEYDTDAPVGIGMRAWAPLIPGDSADSNIPGAVFEVHLRNTSETAQRGTVAFSFPGPTETDPQYQEFTRRNLGGKLRGVEVTSPDGKMGYALGVIGPEKARTGGGLASSPTAWAKIASELPSPKGIVLDRKGMEADGATLYSDPSTSVAVDFDLKPGASNVVRFVLAWYAPDWTGGGYKDITFSFEGMYGPGDWKHPGRETEEGEHYRAMYASRYRDARDVAARLARDHESLLRRVLGWQQAIYASPELPVWLRDCLVNNMNILPEDSYWAQPKEKWGDWAYPNGAFGLTESPRGCAIMGCIVSDWYGNFPTLYFFPELEMQIVRNYKAYMRPDGAAPFLYPNGDFTRPTYEWLLALNGPCFVDLAGRLWLRTGDREVLREFYPAVKQDTLFTMNLRQGPDRAISVHREGPGQEWWEFTPVYGMVTHAGGMRLSNLHIAKRMAEEMGDTEFAQLCGQWLKEGQQVLEDNLWAGDSYLFYSDPITGKKSDDILSSQLDGDWANFFHGLPPVFREDRAKIALDTIWRTCQVEYGVKGFATRPGGQRREPEPDRPTGYGSFTAELAIIGMTYMYYGQRDLGLEIVRRTWDNLVRRQGHGWDLPNMVQCDVGHGERYFGTDYHQCMTLWAVPAALEGKDLRGPCAPGGLVDRVLRSAQAGG